MISTLISLPFIAFTFLWVVFLVMGKIRVVDLYWGLGFFIIAYICQFQLSHPNTAQWLLFGLTMIWALRITGLMAKRHFRAHDEDPRYAEIIKKSGQYAKILVLPTVFWVQALLQFIIAIPIIIGLSQTSAIYNGTLIIMGATIAISGLTLEAIADYQMEMFKYKNAPNALCDTGLWRHSRHPNYVGETLFWWGIGILAFGISQNYWTFISPALLTILIRYVTGVPLMEEQLLKTKTGYAEYLTRVPVFLFKLK